MNESKNKVRTPIFPSYSTVCRLMKIIEGAMKADVLGMMNDIFEQTGTPQNPVDWSAPNIWIKERLKDAVRRWVARDSNPEPSA